MRKDLASDEQSQRGRQIPRLAIVALVLLVVLSTLVVRTPTSALATGAGEKQDSSSNMNSMHLLLEPERAFLEWKAQHSVDALRADPHSRRFVFSELSCPDRAGNLLNYVTYDIIVAMLSNRTILWTYREGLKKNTRQSCDNILQMAP